MGKDTLWDRLLSPIISSFIDKKELERLSKSIDWEEGCNRLAQPDLVYPEYYSSQNFHGITGGYLNSSAPVTYDPITQYVLPPNETWVREAAIEAIGGTPRRILDLGCGTGSTTLMLKQAFPRAQVTGLDLSPYMLVIAEYKAQKAGIEVQWRHGNAQKTAWKAESFDLVTASLLFHETPPEVSKSILRECFRLLIPGGQVVILDGNQQTLRHTSWLTEVFEEPYIKDYATGSVDAWLGAAGFETVHSEDYWFIHQITCALKPLAVVNAYIPKRNLTDLGAAPAF